MTSPASLPETRRWIVVLFALLVTRVAGHPSGNLQIDRLSVEHGLSQTTVWAVSQDHHGLIWMGTEDGLNRYDGYGFRVFEHDPDRADSLAEDEVMALLPIDDGGLWVGTAGGGLDRYHSDHESFEHHRSNALDSGTLTSDHILSLAYDRSGDLWVGTREGLNLRRPDGTFERHLFEPSASPRGPKVWQVFEDPEGRFWVGTNRGLFLRPTKSETFQPLPLFLGAPEAVQSVYAMVPNPEGGFFLGTDQGLCLFDPSERACDSSPVSENWPSKDVVALLLDSKLGLWVGTLTDGLYRRPRGQPDFTHLVHDPAYSRSLSDDSVVCLFEDHGEVVWAGTYVGANRYDPTRDAFTTYRHRPSAQPSLSSSSVWALHEDRSGDLWIGTFNHGLNRLTPESQEVEPFLPDPQNPGALPNGAVNALLEDRKGVLWVGTWGGLARFEPTTRTFRTWRPDPDQAHSLAHEIVQSLLEDSQGRLWVGTYAGLQRFHAQEGRFERPVGSPERSIQTLLEDRQGALWAGSDTGGLYRRSPGQDFESYDRAPVAGLKVASLFEDRNGDLWLGTHNRGLHRIDASRHPVASFEASDGLPNDSILSILEDESGHLWLSTNRGLSRFDPVLETFHNLDAVDGLGGDVFTSGSSLRGRSGELYFGGVHGLTVFRPEDVAGNPHPPQVALTGFQLFNRPVLPQSQDPSSPLEKSILETDEIVLTHRDYVASLEFAALHYKGPHKNRYRYRLEGFDRDWIEADHLRRFATYTNLDPDRYVFQVQASNSDGVWNHEGDHLRIRVLPPPWKSWWAYTLYALFTLLVLALLLRSNHFFNRRLEQLAEERTAQIEALNKELTARNAELEGFTYTVSHDLKSPLITIQGFLGLLQQDVARGALDRIDDDCSRIVQATQKMQQLLEDLLELSRIGRITNPPQKVSLHRLAREVLELLAGPIATNHIQVEVDPALPEVVGDRVRLREVLQNLVENGIKYMGDQEHPTLEIGFEENPRTTPRFFVRDNGIGIAEEHQSRVFGLFQQLSPKKEGTGIGLALVKKIIEFHGGEVWVESAGKGMGSTFYFTVPSSEVE